MSFKGSYVAEQQAMNCEICKTIERLGLDESAHDYWHCTGPRARRLARQETHAQLKQVGRMLYAFFLLKRRQSRIRCQAHYRPRLVTLGI